MEFDNPDLIKFRRQDRANLGLSPANDMILDDGASDTSDATLRASSRSVWSTPTIDAPPETPGSASIAENASTDNEMDVMETSSEVASNETDFIIATDFGTTFSSVAFAKCENGRWGDPQSIGNYPFDPMPWGKISLEVPTESWYPKTAISRRAFENLGDPSEEDDAVADIYNAADVAYQARSTLEGMSIDSDEEMVEANANLPMDDDDTHGIIWGYGIQDRLKASDMDHSQYERVSRSKLILDVTAQTEKVRDKLKPILKQLKKRCTIDTDEDVISDYLKRLFQHAKDQLTRYHGLSDNASIEHVLCVPNVWSPASSRKMQKAMEKAIRDSSLGSMENLFIVAEPEAAAAYVLNGQNDVNPGETFLIIDAGGGTVDLTTYTVHKSYPLRLKAEVTKPSGGLYGSSFLNQAFSEHLKSRVEDENYLETRGFTIDGIVDAAMIEFENRTKRTLDVTKTFFPDSAVSIQGLLASKLKNFRDHRVIMQRNDYLGIFSPLLVKIIELVNAQLSDAIRLKRPVKRAILIGGFGGSPSLRNFLRIELLKFAKDHKTNVRLSDYRAPETAVALGAVLRALNKEDGPRRITRSSYGFLRAEEYDPEHIPAHKRKDVRSTTDKLDGRKYVRNTILWLVKTGEEVPPFKEYVEEAFHTFSIAPKTRFLCEEVVYVSDKSKESHFRDTHKMNEGAERAGRIIADMTFLRDQGIIQPVDPEPGTIGKRHYRVGIELVMIIDGRNLRYEARWPIGGQGTVQERGQICIAAAFEPGTN